MEQSENEEKMIKRLLRFFTRRDENFLDGSESVKARWMIQLKACTGDKISNRLTTEVKPSISLHRTVLVTTKNYTKCQRAEHKIIQQTVQHEWKSKSECVRRRQLKICEKFYYTHSASFSFGCVREFSSISPPNFPLSIARNHHTIKRLFRMGNLTDTPTDIVSRK